MRQYLIRIIYKNGNESHFSPTAVNPGEALIKVIRAHNINQDLVKSFCVKVGEKIV